MKITKEDVPFVPINIKLGTVDDLILFYNMFAFLLDRPDVRSSLAIYINQSGILKTFTVNSIEDRARDIYNKLYTLRRE